MKKFLFLALAIGLFGCGKDDEEQAQEDRDIILNYISDNNHVAIETESGLFYEILDPGRGNAKTPKQTSQVHVAYKGWLTDMTVFDESPNQGAIFELSGLIDAWKEGIPKIKEGGKIMLFSPSALAYGSSSRAGIPANSVLIFEIELKTVID